MLGMETVPIVAAVAMLEPEVAANTAQAATLVCISPPGMRPTQRSSASNIDSVTPERSSNSPIRMNIGMATKMKSALELQATSPKPRSSGKGENNSDRVKPKMPSTATTNRLLAAGKSSR